MLMSFYKTLIAPVAQEVYHQRHRASQLDCDVVKKCCEYIKYTVRDSMPADCACVHKLSSMTVRGTYCERTLCRCT